MSVYKWASKPTWGHVRSNAMLLVTGHIPYTSSLDMIYKRVENSQICQILNIVSEFLPVMALICVVCASRVRFVSLNWVRRPSVASAKAPATFRHQPWGHLSPAAAVWRTVAPFIPGRVQKSDIVRWNLTIRTTHVTGKMWSFSQVVSFLRLLCM